jgi:hypothetical protein
MAVLLASIPVASAVNPNNRTDKQVHGILTHGNKGTIQEVKTTLIDEVNMSWAKSFIGEFVLTWDSYASHAVGAGWFHFKHPSGTIQSSQTLYYFNANNGLSGLFKEATPPGQRFQQRQRKAHLTQPASAITGTDR